MSSNQGKKTAGSKAGSGFSDTVEEAAVPDMSGEQAALLAAAFLSPTDQEEMSSTQWKERLAVAVKLEEAIASADAIAASEAVALFKMMEIKSKNWKETNFQVRDIQKAGFSKAARDRDPFSPLGDGQDGQHHGRNLEENCRVPRSVCVHWSAGHCEQTRGCQDQNECYRVSALLQ